MIMTNDGSMVNKSGSSIVVTGKKTEIYSRIGNMLSGPGGVVSMNCKSDDEALWTVVGLHGGRRI